MSQQKMEIDAEKLTEIILCKNLNSDKHNDTNLEESLYTYIKYIEAKIEEHKVEDYISIKPIKKNVFIKELGYEIYYGYKVTISNLIINIKKRTNIALKLVTNISYPAANYNPIDMPWIGLLFEFKDNCFKCKEGEDRSFISVTSGHYIALSFIGNHFRCSDFNINVVRGVTTLINFHGNFSKNTYMSVSEPVIDSDNEIKRPPKQSEELDKLCAVRLSDNNFKVLNIVGQAYFYFLGKNIIQLLRKADSAFLYQYVISTLPKVYWGAYQKLNQDGESFLIHKEIFTILKQRAIANNDVMQEIILQREISKCDHAIAKSEKWRAWQDRMIFWFSKWISNYGTSWIMPLGWLAGLNLIIVVSLYASSDHDFKMWAAFWKLFNPTNSLANMPWPKEGINGLISFLFIFQKVVLAFTLYEMIKIFRRFGKR